MQKKKLYLIIGAAVLVTLSLIFCILFFRGSKKKEPTDFGKLEVSASSKSQDFASEIFMPEQEEIPDIYQKDHFQSIRIGEGVDMSKLKDEDVAVGKAYFLSDKNPEEFIEKEIKYVKGDIAGFLNTYHQLLCNQKEATITIRLDGAGNLTVNFTSFSPTVYLLKNEAFRKAYMDTSEGVSDVRFQKGAELAVLRGYYKSIKANFPQVQYVYFLLGGNPWEVIDGEIHDGLLFLEPGQTRPEKAPEFLRQYEREDFNRENGFSNHYTGDRVELVATPAVPQARNFSGNTPNETESTGAGEGGANGHPAAKPKIENPAEEKQKSEERLRKLEEMTLEERADFLEKEQEERVTEKGEATDSENENGEVEGEGEPLSPEEISHILNDTVSEP